MSKQKKKNSQLINTRAVVKIIGLTGCLNMMIALCALVLGLWLDELFGMGGALIVILVTASVPLSIYIMVRVALNMVGKADLSVNPNVADEPQDKEE